ncbi:MAG: hypothetical protein SYR96_27160 [Actinomycetota bacterium]|nr:hypothetical protein [Actinomycetota bacterium]
MASLDDALTKLLDGGGPPAAVARGMLSGLREALASVSPGEREVSAAIARLLSSPISTPPDLAPDKGLAALWERTIPAVDERSPGEPARDVGRLWDEIHLLGLRMSADDRTDLEARVAAEARASGAEPGAATTVVLGLVRETLIPALRVGGRVVSTGLATAPDAPPPPDLPTGGDAEAMALLRLAAPILTLVSRDRHLSHCLQILQSRGLASLAAPTEQERLRNQLVSRVTTVTGMTTHSMDWLEQLVRAHEAITSVVHVPPAPEGSWWGRLRLHAHTVVRDGANLVGPGLVKLPPSRFTAARAFTEHDIPLKVPESTGMVLACVRVWSRIHDVESPGRVIYAS